MPLRLLEIIIPEKSADDLYQLLGEHETVDTWTGQLSDDTALVRTLLSSTEIEKISDTIEDKFGEGDRFRILIYSIEATIPQPDIDEEEQANEEDEVKLQLGRISREELYADIAPGATLSAVYLITVLLSALVASIGLLLNDVTIIIGAMVIAPLLRPNVALALAVSLGDLDLGKKAIKANITGTVSALLLAVLLGFIFTVDSESAQIAARTNVHPGHIPLALAVGVAGALAFTTGVSTTLIGVMVAVALLPSLVTSGLLAGAGYWSLAGPALILFLANVTGINLASVVTFWALGIRPRQWWEEERAERATRFTIIFWVLLLLAFLAFILLL